MGFPSAVEEAAASELCLWLSTRWSQRLQKLTKPFGLPLLCAFSTRCDWSGKDSRWSESEWRWRRWKHLNQWPQRRADAGQSGGCRGEAGGGGDQASETSQHPSSTQPACQTAHQTGQLRRCVQQDSHWCKISVRYLTRCVSLLQVLLQCRWRSPLPPYPGTSLCPKTLMALCWEAGSPHPPGPLTSGRCTHSCPPAASLRSCTAPWLPNTDRTGQAWCAAFPPRLCLCSCQRTQTALWSVSGFAIVLLDRNSHNKNVTNVEQKKKRPKTSCKNRKSISKYISRMDFKDLF